MLSHGAQSISDVINVPGYINLDFADVTSVMQNAGYAHMGVGEATGKDKAEMAAKAAISSPLLESSIDGAHGILVNITASPDIGLEDIDVASSMITASAAPDANVIWGVIFDPDLEDNMKITIIATGFEKKAEEAPADAPAAGKPAAPAEESEKKNDDEVSEEDSQPPISDDEFNEIINMLKKNRKADAAKQNSGAPGMF